MSPPFNLVVKGRVNYSYEEYNNSSNQCYKIPESLELCLFNLNKKTESEYINKDVINWTAKDSVTWLFDTMFELKLFECDIPCYNFKFTGEELCDIKKDAFVSKLSLQCQDVEEISDSIFNNLQMRINKNLPKPKNKLDLDMQQPDKMSRDLSQWSIKSNLSSDSAECKEMGEVLKRRRGRPKGSTKTTVKKKDRNTRFLPEFLQDMLLNPVCCPEYIRWTDIKKRMFELVNPEVIIQAWKQRNNKLESYKKTDYANFTRAMRYHYKTKKLKIPEIKTRRVYQFGDKFSSILTDRQP